MSAQPSPYLRYVLGRQLAMAEVRLTNRTQERDTARLIAGALWDIATDDARDTLRFALGGEFPLWLEVGQP